MFSLLPETSSEIPVSTGNKCKVILFEVAQFGYPPVKLLQSLFKRNSLIDHFLCNSSEFSTKFGQIGVERWSHILVKDIQLFSGGKVCNNDRKLYYLRAGLYLLILNAGGFEVQDEDELKICFWFFCLHIFFNVYQRISVIRNSNIHQSDEVGLMKIKIGVLMLEYKLQINTKIKIRKGKLMQTQHSQKHPVQRHIQALEDAYKVHNDLLNTINEMDKKIEEVIKCHQAEFLIAYRNHIKNMKQELAEIKFRTQEQEKQMMSNQRSVFLEKQIILFREEAIRLYDKLEEKMEQNQAIKSNNKELERSNALLQRQNREQLREIRILQTQKGMVESQIQVLCSEKQTLNEQIQTLKQKLAKEKLAFGVTTKTNTGALLHKYGTPKYDESYLPMPVNSRTGKRRTEPKLRQTFGDRMNTLQERKRMSSEVLDHQVKNCFIDCLETIRREVGQRKVYGAKSDDINNISSWQEFRMIDKLRLLQMFLQNEKLLVWMYEKVFPNRLSEIESYFQVKKVSNSGLQSRVKSKSMNIQIDDATLEDLNSKIQDKIKGQQDSTLLPKVEMSVSKKKKEKKYDVRSRIEMKNGKLNISQFSKDSQ